MKKEKIYAIVGAIVFLALSLATMAGYTQTVIHFEGFKNELAFAFVSLFLSFVLFVLGFGKEEESFGNYVKKN
jgi:high-affinity Fe2+/Pb2+ permease